MVGGSSQMSKVFTSTTCVVVLIVLTVGTVSLTEARHVGSMQSAQVLADGRIVGEQASDRTGNHSDVQGDVATSVDGALAQVGSGAQWSIKLPSCPSDLEICCSFFQNWNWASWGACGKEVLNVGKSLLKKALELLDYLTDPRKLAKFVFNSPVTNKFWQLWDWGKRAIKAFKTAFENVLEGLVKVVMAMVRLVLGMMKIPGCWKLDSNRREWTAFGGGFKGTDCGAMSSLKKIAMWGFIKNLGSCFIRLSPIPSSGTVKLPTPFLSVKEGPFCVYHIPAIVQQLIDGCLQIAKAIVMLVVDLVALGLELIDIVAGFLFKGTPLEALVKSGPKLRAAAQRLVNGQAPDAPEVTSATGLVRNRHGICLDASQRSSNGGRVHMWGCNAANANQNWVYSPTTGLIRSKYGICLDASQRSSNGGRVHMWGCNAGNLNQQWAYNSATGQLKNRHGICLDASQRNSNGGLVHMWACNTGNLNQQWIASFFASSSSSASLSQVRGEGELEQTQEQHDEKSTSVFRAMFSREMSALEDSVAPTTSDGVVESSHLELARESSEAERVIRHLVTQHQAVHPSAWEHVLAAGSSSLLDRSQDASSDASTAEEDELLVQKWVVSMSGKMDVDAMLESAVASMLAEETVGSNGDKLGYYFQIGGTVKCSMEFAKFVFLHPVLLLGAFLIPILDPKLAGGASLAFSLGRTSNSNGGKFSIGVSMGFAISASGSLDIFRLWNSWGEVLKSAEGKMSPETIKLCDNWGKSMFGVSITPVGLLGASCAPLTAAKGKVSTVFGGGKLSPSWGFGLKLPLVVKSLAQIIGLPFDKTPGDALSIAVGWKDFKATKDAWFFGLGVNPLPTLPDPTTTKSPPPPAPLVVDFSLGASWTWFLGIPCGSASRSLLATNLRSSVRARMEATCSAGSGIPSCVGSTGAAGLAKCVQESTSARLSCGGGAHLEALGHMSSAPVVGEDVASSTSPVVDRTLNLKFHGDGAGSLPVRVVAGWVSGLSTLRVVDVDANAASATSVAGGVRSIVSLASQSDIQLRAVCLQWDATAARNAFRPITGEGHTTRQRARQMASAMEAKLQQDSGSVDSAEHARIASWVRFVKEYDAAQPEIEQHSVQRFSTEWASDADGVVGTLASQRCFKVRIGGVRAHLDASVSGSSDEAKGAFVGTSADLHSFTLSALSSSLETSVAQSPALVQAVAEFLGSFDESSAATEVVQSALRSTIAAQLVAGTQSALERNMCGSLKSVICPSCEHGQASVSWREQCSSLVSHDEQ